MKLLSYFTGLLIAYFMYGFYISQVESSVIPLELKPENAPGYYDYRGVSNVLTELSNGSSTPQQVIADAKTAGLDYLVLTDRNRFGETTNVSGYHGNVLVLDEGEYSFLDSRLLLYSLNHNQLPSDSNDNSIYFTDLLTQTWSPSSDKLVVLAHPFNQGPTWTGPYPTGLDGIEILNPKSIAKKAWERSKLSVLWSFITYPFNARFAFLRLFREPSEEIGLWDKLNESRPTWGFAGADANARAIPLANYLVKFPSYALSLSVVSNHILLPTELTGNFEKDREKIFYALKRGQFYTALDLIGNTKGFIAKIEDRDESHLMGSKIKMKKGLKLFARLPIEPKDFYEIVVIKNGEKEAISNAQELGYEIKSPGVYRVVVRVSSSLPLPDGRKWITWIYTNPFFVE